MTPIEPLAVNDVAETPLDVNETVAALANDSAGAASAPLDPTTVVLQDPADGVFKKNVTVPGEGTFTVDPVTGQVTFNPEPDFVGVTTPLVYQVKDTNGTPAEATITITVAGPPQVAPDTGTTPQNTNVEVDPLANDLPGLFGGAPIDPTTVLLKDPADGTFKPTVTIPGEGKYTVDPTTGKVTFDPEPGFTGPATPVSYQVADEDGTTATSTITITVTPVKPTAVDNTATTPKDTNVTLDLPANDTPGSASAPLDSTTVQLKDPADGTFKTTVTIPGEGKYTVDPATGKVTFDPEPTFAGTTAPLTYQIKDANGTATTAELTVVVKEGPKI
ncbi:MAG: Ig-like domain-containing protein, partial [Angustibacter sp.]